MKKAIRAMVSGMVTLSLVGLSWVPSSWAVTDEQFQALEKKVDDQDQLLQQVLKQNQQYRQEIQDLRQQQGQTQEETQKIQQTADQAAQTAQAAQAQAASKSPSAAGFLNIPKENHNFVVAGDAEIEYTSGGGGLKSRSSYALADFAPIFLFRANDNVLFEAGFDTNISNASFDTSLSPNPGAAVGTSGGNQGYSTSFNLSFATLDYIFNDYVTFMGGLMILPLGSYAERSAGWLNKLPDDPLARSLLINTGVGAQLRGGQSIGDKGAQLTYNVYTVNGGHSVDNTPFATTVDSGGNTIQNFDPTGNVNNLNRQPSEGGRLAFFYPFKPHYDVELGISGQTGEWDTSGKMWQAGVIDGAMHLSPYFETKGEYIYTRERTADMGMIAPQGWWLQQGFKLAYFDTELPLIPSTELVFRYDYVNNAIGTLTNTPKASRRYEPGLVYYITNSLWLKGSYEKIFNSGGVPSGNEWLLELSYGF